MTKQEAATNFMKRGWLEIQSKKYNRNFYLVKNRMVRVPDKKLFKLTKKELKQLVGLPLREREFLLEAKGIFKGEICTK